MIFFTFLLPFLQKSALHGEICYYYAHHLKGRIGFMSRKRKIFIALVLAFCQIFCILHIPFKVVPDNQKDVQISSVAHYTAHQEQTQSQYQHLDSEQKVCNIEFFFCESIFFFAIAKFLYEITKITVYIWQLPRSNISAIMQ